MFIRLYPWSDVIHVAGKVPGSTLCGELSTQFVNAATSLHVTRSRYCDQCVRVDRAKRR